jgi:hypothetical protein
MNLTKMTFEYVSNWTSSQIEKKVDHPSQNDQWFFNQIKHFMLINKAT